MEDLRYLLKNGVFGKMSNGYLFVVVDDKILYKSGGWDRLCDCRSDLTFNYYKIDYLVDTYCFDTADRITLDPYGDESDIIYDRSGKYGVTKKSVDMTIEEIEEKLGITNLKIIGGNN